MTAAVPARVNLITLGATDRAASQRFYEKLGWQPKARAYEASITFLGLDNLVLALWDRDKLAEDAKLPLTPPGFGGFTLAINLPDEKAVDQALDAGVQRLPALQTDARAAQQNQRGRAAARYHIARAAGARLRHLDGREDALE